VTKNPKLRIRGDVAEIVLRDAPKKKSDLVRTSAESRVRKAAKAAAVGLNEMAGIIVDLAKAFSDEVGSRNFNNDQKITIKFGITGGANADFIVVNAKADSFISVELEIPVKGGSASAAKS